MIGRFSALIGGVKDGQGQGVPRSVARKLARLPASTLPLYPADTIRRPAPPAPQTVATPQLAPQTVATPQAVVALQAGGQAVESLVNLPSEESQAEIESLAASLNAEPLPPTPTPPPTPEPPMLSTGALQKMADLRRKGLLN